MKRMKSPPPLDRSRICMIGTALIEVLVEELARPRVPSPQTDTVRLAYTRALTQALSVYAGILKDEDMEQMKKKLELLMAATHAEKRA
jgi:hypothetical protein